MSQQPFLSDPDYEVTKEDKRAALIVLGVTVTVWPTEGYPERIRYTLMPPDVGRFCEDDLVQLFKWSSASGSSFAALCV